ncbi:MAG: response regulator [Dehalococcoidia bacterium]
MDQNQTLPVLLVEDNEIDIAITQRMIARSAPDIALSVARGGAQALEVLFDRTQPAPRLVLLDLGLPDVGGQEVLRRIKDHLELSIVPVAVLTGAPGERVMMDCLRLGGNMFFVKPIAASDVRNLVTAVRRYWEVMEALQRTARKEVETTHVDEEA